MQRPRLWLWLIPALAYLAFYGWYTNLSGPLTAAEIESYTSAMRANGRDPIEVANIRRFMEEDTGNQFIMINALDLNENPPNLPATGPDANAGDLLGHYMEHMYPAQFARASHPVFFGMAVFTAMDVSGIQGAEEWDQGALFRYRSRRDIMDIVVNPAFDERHDYKMGGLTKTIAYPVEASLYYADMRVMMAFLLFTIAAVLDIMIFRRTT